MDRTEGMVETLTESSYFLLRSASRICALPLASVVEVFRPLPLRPVQGSPPYVAGLAVIRGAAIPVVDLERLLGGRGGAEPGRFVTLRVGSRSIALAVESVLGVRSLAESVFHALPPLLSDSEHPVIDALGSLDSELLVLLSAGRILPEGTP
jgi:purine-binding chemotaxis protein CheW